MKYSSTILTYILLQLNFAAIAQTFIENPSFDKLPIIESLCSKKAKDYPSKEINKSIACYLPLFIGKYQDSIEICTSSSPSHVKRLLGKIKFFNSYELNKNQHLEIFVDTSQIIIIQNLTKIEKVDSINNVFDCPFYKSNPVFIKNMGRDTATVGNNYEYDKLILTLEAKDSNGKWKPIEEDPHLPNCNFGIFPIKLLPDEIVLTTVHKREGNFSTELRLKLGNHYSNEFLGNINPNLFKEDISKIQTLKK